MLDLGFIHALKRIVAWSRPSARPCSSRRPCRRRSRNWPTAICTNPAEVAVTPVAKTADRVEQSVVMVNQAEKTALLTLFLQAEEVERALVFSRTKHGADKIVRDARRGRHRGQRDPRQQEPAAARAGASPTSSRAR